jgi:PEP-CTERM motif-containing protein
MSGHSSASVGIILESLSRFRLLTHHLRPIQAFQEPGAPSRIAQTAPRFVIAGVAALVLALALLLDRAEAAVLSAAPSFSLTVEVPGDIVPVPVSFTAGPSGSFIADGTAGNADFSLHYQFSVIADPTLSGSFTLTNLTGHTQTFSISATLGVLPLAGPTSVSGFFGDAHLSAPVGTGEATLTANPFYQARIDGATVKTLGSKLNVTTTGGAFTIPMESFLNQAGPAVNSSIGVAFLGFTLTGLHSVQVPFGVTVASVPEPSSVVLLVLGLAVAFLRWRKLPVDARRGA